MYWHYFLRGTNTIIKVNKQAPKIIEVDQR